MVVERSAVIEYDKHVASRMFSPDEWRCWRTSSTVCT